MKRLDMKNDISIEHACQLDMLLCLRKILRAMLGADLTLLSLYGKISHEKENDGIDSEMAENYLSKLKISAIDLNNAEKTVQDAIFDHQAQLFEALGYCQLVLNNVTVAEISGPENVVFFVDKLQIM